MPGYISNRQSLFIGTTQCIYNFGNPLGPGGPEMKCICFHRNCWKKLAPNDTSHGMDISRITKVVLKNCQKIGKMTSLTVKN